MKVIAFELNAPMSSWATGGASIIPTMSEPTWSAVVGMIGASLGLPRGDGRLVKIASDFALAVKVKVAGQREHDFNTIESPQDTKVKGLRARTRFQELDFEGKDLNTSIIQREYVQGAVYVVYIVQMTESPVYSLDEIQFALANPVYPLSAGRRSCVIGLVHAKNTSVDDLALATHWDQRIPIDKVPTLIRERHDQLIGPHQFAVRFECVA
jgi:CRISPR system Cascade subunit CasD